MTWELGLVLQIVDKIHKILVIHQLAKFGNLMSCYSKDILKNATCLVLTVIMTSQVWKIMGLFKGYLSYKMIASQNEPCEAFFWEFFYFLKKLCSILKIFKFLYFHILIFCIYQICDVTMSITTWDSTYLKISFEPQFINRPYWVNW